MNYSFLIIFSCPFYRHIVCPYLVHIFGWFWLPPWEKQQIHNASDRSVLDTMKKHQVCNAPTLRTQYTNGNIKLYQFNIESLYKTITAQYGRLCIDVGLRKNCVVCCGYLPRPLMDKREWDVCHNCFMETPDQK